MIYSRYLDLAHENDLAKKRYDENPKPKISSSLKSYHKMSDEKKAVRRAKSTIRQRKYRAQAKEKKLKLKAEKEAEMEAEMEAEKEAEEETEKAEFSELK